jgi:hypothetical protein
MVSDELQAPEANGFTDREANTGLVLTIGDDDELW